MKRKMNWFWKRKWYTKIIILILVVSAYMNIGRIVEYGWYYSFYYPESGVSKVMFFGHEDKNIPLNKSEITEKTNKRAHQYKSFDEYYKAEHNIILVLLWPVIVVVCLFTGILSWSTYGLFQVVLGLVWLWNCVVNIFTGEYILELFR